MHFRAHNEWGIAPHIGQQVVKVASHCAMLVLVADPLATPVSSERVARPQCIRVCLLTDILQRFPRRHPMPESVSIPFRSGAARRHRSTDD